MPKPVLVTYATRAGSTAEVAAEIGRVLAGRGLAVEVLPVKDAAPASQYRALVIGSAVRMGKWLPEALAYVQRHAPSLARMPVAVFTVHALNTASNAPSEANRLGYLEALRPLLHPAAQAFFPGKIDPAQLCLFERLTLQAPAGPATDWRDWEAIRRWAGALPI